MSFTITIQDQAGFLDEHLYAESEKEAYDLALDEMVAIDDPEVYFIIEDDESGASRTYDSEGGFLW